MPLTAVVVALATKLLIGLSWTESFLVGALLSPTDPVLSSNVVTNPRVPAIVRGSLNLESGLNDGLALPAVLALAASLAPSGHFVVWQFVCENLGFGFGVGLVVGLVASLTPTRPLAAHQQALVALGVAFLAYGAAVLLPNGNGLIAVFVAAIVLGIRRPDMREAFAKQSLDLVEIVKLGIFAVFGSLLTWHGLTSTGWAGLGVALVTLFVARPIAVMSSLVGTPIDLATRGFMAWFGPKGVATMTFSLLILSEHLAHGNTIFDLAALTVIISVFAHGVTDRAGAEWMGNHAESSGRPGRRSGVKRGLLRRRRERPGDLQPALSSEHEPQLARRPQSLGPVGPERRAGTVLTYRAQLVALKEALLTARLLNCSTFRHYPANSPLRLECSTPGRGIKADFPAAPRVDSRKTQELHICSKTLKFRHVLPRPRYFVGL